MCKTLQSETSGISDVFKTSGAECDADAAGWHIPVAQDDLDLIKLTDCGVRCQRKSVQASYSSHLHANPVERISSD